MPPAQGKCTVDTSSSQIATSVTNTVADFAVLLLPIAVLLPLQMHLAKKIALVSVFLIGTLWVMLYGQIEMVVKLTVLQCMCGKHSPLVLHDQDAQ